MAFLPGFLTPSRSVPLTRWRSESRWSSQPSTLAILVGGLWIFGTGEALLVVADLGVGPWTVFAQGLTARTGLNIGLTTFMISVVVLLAWIPLRERLGLGTIANAIVIATALEVMSTIIPHPTHRGLQILLVVAGIDFKTGWPVARVRLGIEVGALTIGWFLGGTVGIGTVLFAVLVGPFVAYGLKAVGILAGAKQVIETDQEPELDA